MAVDSSKMMSMIALPPVMFSRSVPSVMSEPATRDDQAMTTLRGETKLHDERGTIDDRLCTDVSVMETRIARQLEQSLSELPKEVVQNIAKFMAEKLVGFALEIKERCQDPPRQQAEARAAHDEHAADVHLHRRRSATPAKRARRS